MRSINFHADLFEPFTGKAPRSVAGGALRFVKFEIHQLCQSFASDDCRRS